MFSYDDIAEQYASAAEPHYFTRPAEDLLSLLDVAPDTTFFDLGAGSGAVAAAARRRIRDGRVLACDRAVAMLVVARSRVRALWNVAGDLTVLPLRSAACDVATAGFVLSHLSNPVAALREIRRVLIVGGKVGVTAWSAGAASSAPGESWLEVAGSYVPVAELDEAVAGAVPSEPLLATEDGMRGALFDARFSDIQSFVRTYSVVMPTSRFVESRLLSAPARSMHARLAAAEWQRFVREVSQTLLERFGTEVSFPIGVNFGIARKAG